MYDQAFRFHLKLQLSCTKSRYHYLQNLCVLAKHSSEKYEMIGKFPVLHHKCKF